MIYNNTNTTSYTCADTGMMTCHAKRYKDKRTFLKLEIKYYLPDHAAKFLSLITSIHFPQSPKMNLAFLI